MKSLTVPNYLNILLASTALATSSLFLSGCGGGGSGSASANTLSAEAGIEKAIEAQTAQLTENIKKVDSEAERLSSTLQWKDFQVTSV
jgi:hypothetical protein